MNDRPHPPQVSVLRAELRSWIALRARRRGLEHQLDDLLGAADLALLEATRRHDPARGPLGPFAHLAVKHATLRYLRRERVQEDVARVLRVAEPACDYGAPLEPELHALIRHPTGLDRLAIAHLLHGVPLRSLAEHHGVTYHRARAAVAAVRVQISEALERPQASPEAPSSGFAPGAAAPPGRAARSLAEPTGASRPQRPHHPVVSSPQRPCSAAATRRRRQPRARPACARPPVESPRPEGAGTVPASGPGDRAGGHRRDAVSTYSPMESTR